MGRRSRNAEKSTKQRLLESAIRSVANYGIEGSTTARLAHEAEISEAMIYKCFADKTDLMNMAFLQVDKTLSDFVLNHPFFKDQEKGEVLTVVNEIWNNIYDYLMNHREEALFLIRYRYSSLYSDEIRNQRQTYNGAFDKVFEVAAPYFAGSGVGYRGFLTNYAFELTLSFAEKVHTGRIQNTEELRKTLWALIASSVGMLKKTN